jgi:hypothetical protein
VVGHAEGAGRLAGLSDTRHAIGPSRSSPALAVGLSGEGQQVRGEFARP